MYYVKYLHKDEDIERDLYIPGDLDHTLADARLSLEMGKAGDFVLAIPDTNPAKDDIVCLTDEIIVYRDKDEIFRGRAVTDQVDFDLTGTLECEGILAYLYDTYYMPFEFQGSPKDLFRMILENHNSKVEPRKQFEVGDITVEDNNDYINRSSIYYDRTLTVLTEKLIEDSLGGYFRVRVEDGVRYLDYLVAYNTTASQPVRYGYNLLDIAQDIEYADVATVIIPLGAKLEDEDGIETDERLTVASVNGGSIYIVDEAAVAINGWIEVSAEWDDVTLPENLYTKGYEYLMQVENPISKFDVSVVDLSKIGEEEAFNLGDFVLIRVDSHGINQMTELTGMDLNLLHQDEDVLHFGADYASLTSSSRSSDASVKDSLGNLSLRVGSITANVLDAVYANIETLIATTINTEYIQAICADIGYLTVNDLVANEAYIKELLADFVTVNVLQGNYATFEDLQTVSFVAETAAIDVANIESVLSGNVGTGNLTAITLTAANLIVEGAIITDAMIYDVSADKLTAGTIYTDVVKIANNEGQNLWIDGATIQITDENDTVRVQIGMDASGDYNLYLWDEEGALIWNAYGLTEEGLLGNGAIIRDAAVADDANINESKIDMQSVADRLNDDGMIIVDGTNVIVDGSTLTYQLTQMQIAIDDLGTLESYGIIERNDYFALGTNDEEPPGDPEVTSSALGEFVLGYATLGGSGEGDLWSMEWPEITEEDEAAGRTYRWMCTQLVYQDGTVAWTTPICLSDGYVRSQTTTLITSLEIVQGQIESKVWMTDIIDAVSPLEEDYAIISQQYTDVIQTVDSITSTVADLELTVGADVEEMRTQVAEIRQLANEIDLEVSDVYQYIDSEISIINDQFSEIDITINGVFAQVGQIEQAVEKDYTELSSRIVTVEETAEGLSTRIEAVDNYISEEVESLTQQIFEIDMTASGLEASLTNLEAIVDDNNNYLVNEIAQLQLTVEGLSLSFETINSELGNDLVDMIPYYALGTSDTEPPSDPSDTSSALGSFILGEAVLGGDNTSDWSQEPPDNPDGLYLWQCYQKTYKDGTVVWTEPFCVTDGWARNTITYCGSSLEILQDAIDAKVWQADIETAVGPLGEQVESVEYQYSLISERIDSIDMIVGDYSSVTGEGYSTICEAISQIHLESQNISLSVSYLEAWQEDFSIGGRNLLLDSEKKTATRTDTSTNYITYGTLGFDVSDYGVSCIQDGGGSGAKFHLSFDYQIDGITTATTIYPAVLGANDRYYPLGQGAPVSVGSNSGHYSYTWTDNTNVAADGRRWRLTGFGEGSNGGTVITITHIQLEVGTEETDWSVAPEDVEDFVRTYTTAQIELGIDEIKGNVVSYINESADIIYLEANRLVIDSTYFSLSSSGYVTATGGTIGGWTLTNERLYALSSAYPRYSCVLQAPTTITSDASAMWIGHQRTNSSDWDYPFYLLYNGFLHAENAEVTGTLATISGSQTARLSGGGVRFEYDGDDLGGFEAAKWTETDIRGIAMHLPYDNNFMSFSRKQAADAETYTVAYYICYDTSISTYRHNFSGSVRFSNDVYFFGELQISDYASFEKPVDIFSTLWVGGALTVNTDPIYLSNSYALRGYEASGSGYASLVYCNSDNEVAVGDSDHDLRIYSAVKRLRMAPPTSENYYPIRLYKDSDNYAIGLGMNTSGQVLVGDSDYPTYIRGTNIYANGQSLTSDARLKCDFADLDGSYDAVFDSLSPVVFRFRKGGGKHMGFTTQNVQEALEAAGKDYTDYGLISHYTEDDGASYGALAYNEIIALLAYELKKTKKRVAELEAALG